jgi:DNA-binding SARP family transcriptional activator
MPRLSLRLLGPPQIELDGEPVHIPRRKAMAFLAYLTLTAEERAQFGLPAR